MLLPESCYPSFGMNKRDRNEGYIELKETYYETNYAILDACTEALMLQSYDNYETVTEGIGDIFKSIIDAIVNFFKKIFEWLGNLFGGGSSKGGSGGSSKGSSSTTITRIGDITVTNFEYGKNHGKIVDEIINNVLDKYISFASDKLIDISKDFISDVKNKNTTDTSELLSMIKRDGENEVYEKLVIDECKLKDLVDSNMKVSDEVKNIVSKIYDKYIVDTKFDNASSAFTNISDIAENIYHGSVKFNKFVKSITDNLTNVKMELYNLVKECRQRAISEPWSNEWVVYAKTATSITIKIIMLIADIMDSADAQYNIYKDNITNVVNNAVNPAIRDGTNNIISGKNDGTFTREYVWNNINKKSVFTCTIKTTKK